MVRFLVARPFKPSWERHCFIKKGADLLGFESISSSEESSANCASLPRFEALARSTARASSHSDGPDDLAQPPLPDAIVTTPPPAPPVETAPPPPSRAMLGTRAFGPGKARSTNGRLEATSASPPTARLAFPPLGDNTPPNGPASQAVAAGRPTATTTRTRW